MTNGFVVSTSDELNLALADAALRPLIITAGTYEVEVEHIEPGVIQGGGESITHLNFRQSQRLKQLTHFHNLHLRIFDGAPLDVTYAAHSSFDNCIVSPPEGQKARCGILSSVRGDQDNSYGIVLNNTHVKDGFKYGVLIEKNKDGRVNGWKILDSVFDHCEYGLWGEHFANAIIRGGIFEVCDKIGLYLHGHANSLTRTHFERNGLDIRNMATLGDDTRPEDG